jgi:hypothetical protein
MESAPAITDISMPKPSRKLDGFTEEMFGCMVLDSQSNEDQLRLDDSALRGNNVD